MFRKKLATCRFAISMEPQIPMFQVAKISHILEWFNYITTYSIIQYLSKHQIACNDEEKISNLHFEYDLI